LLVAKFTPANHVAKGGVYILRWPKLKRLVLAWYMGGLRRPRSSYVAYIIHKTAFIIMQFIIGLL